LHSNQNQEKSEEFIELRYSIENRIEELEDFFEDNFDNEFIFYFERGRYKLKKLLMYEPNLLDEINNGKNMKAFIFGQKSQVSQSTPDILIGQDTDITKFSNNNFLNKNNTKSYEYSQKIMFSKQKIIHTALEIELMLVIQQIEKILQIILIKIKFLHLIVIQILKVIKILW
jgi:hypothetical protein